MIASIVRTRRASVDQAGTLVPRLVVELQGQGGAAGRLTAAVAQIRAVVKAVGQAIHHGREGAYSREVDLECELYVVAWDEAGRRAELELSPGPAQLILFASLGEEALAAFLTGLTTIAARDLDPRLPPHGFDAAGLEEVRRLAGLLGQGLSALVFALGGRRAVLGLAERDYLRLVLDDPPGLERMAVVGRLVSLDGQQGLAGMVWDFRGRGWLCRFREEHVGLLAGAWLKTVELRGRATLLDHRRRLLEVESLAVAAGQAEPPPPPPGDEADPLEELLALLPAEESPEEILSNILAE